MIVKNNVSLKYKTSFRMGGIAKKFYIPETTEELLDLVKNLKSQNEKFKILSGGSNILINDNALFDNVIYMGYVDLNQNYLGSGRFYIGASNRIQKVINFVNDFGYGGIEELVGLPALFGGIVCMNAGIGAANNEMFNISDFIQKVKVLDINKGIICYLDKEECSFSYRNSVFKENSFIIIGAVIKLSKQDKSISKQRIINRVKYCKVKQDRGKGCFGTCFSKASPKLLRMVSIFRPRSGSIRFGTNNKNWLVNDGNGKFDDAISIIEICQFVHKLFHKEIKLEVIIWE